MSARTLMVQGTTSDAGKSTLVAGLCRVMHRRGVRVAPFKPQNMSLNSAVGADGGELGRAQALQAQAAGIEPTSDMNPVLLKPHSDTGAQVIIQGRPVGELNPGEYHDYKRIARDAVLASTSASPRATSLSWSRALARPPRSICAPVILPTWDLRKRSTARWC